MNQAHSVPSNTTEQRASFDFQENPFISRVVQNVQTDLIQITGDKLENILMKHEEKKRKKDAWINPFGLMVSFILTITTTDPKQTALGLSQATWQAIFVLLLVGSICWLIYSFYQAKTAMGESSIESLINQIKNESSTP